VDHKISKAVRLELEDCLFCPTKFDTFEANMDHMTKIHGFFIPDIEYLSDLKGLVKYLGEKVAVANVCLHCNGKGRELKSLEAVRKHMKDKGHCKIAYDHDMDIMEISDFYDYRPSYGVALEGDEDQELDGEQQKAMLAEDDMELVLPSGTRLGHRSLRKYYKQHIRQTDDSETIEKTIEWYEEQGIAPPPQSRGRRMMITQGEQPKVPAHHGFKEVKHREHYRTRVGVNANRLQRHFREQLLQ
jgi:pre-60S factor REI1